MKKCIRCNVEYPEDNFYTKLGKPYAHCKGCHKKQVSEYNKNNPDKIKKHSDKYNSSEHGKLKNAEQRKKWQENNREKHREATKRWKLNNRDKVLEAKKRKRERDKSNPLLVMQGRLRRRTVKAFSVSRWNKKSKNVDMLGCSWEEAFNHIESKFTDGMSWENRNLWHIDHIIPLSSATTEEELIKLCHYTNLQPLWAIDNLKKGDRIL